MSRIDEAWRKTSGQNTATVERLEDSSESVLHRYPAEKGRFPVASASLSDRLPHPTIAAPRTGEKRNLGPLPAALAGKLVTGDRTKPLAVEQYRRLAGAVHELQVEQGLKTLMVTSAVPHEGKTLTAVNLALTLSESCERRVLLIDADLRRPFVHEVFQLPNTKGLSDALRADGGESPLMQISEFLSVLPAGRTTEPMALTSDRMRILLDHYAASFDWVLLDAAPVGFMPDAQLLARLTRAVLFVIASHSTPHSLVSRAISEIGPECIVGTVLNRVDEQDIPAAGYYEEYYSSARNPV